MATKIANYCRNHFDFFALIEDRATMRRAAKLAALEYAMETASDFNACLSEDTINSVINKLWR